MLNLKGVTSVFPFPSWVIISSMEEGRGVCWVLVGRHKGKRPLGRPRYTLEDNIKMDVREIGMSGTN